MNDDPNAPPPPSLQDFQKRSSRNPFQSDLPAVTPIGALANAEQQRSIAEVQARMIIARANPRDPMRCMDQILQDCTRPTLAREALYQYSRGGTAISGPSIRLAESIARRWGNIASGIKEISRANGYSECVAYAWDLETGYYDERQYQVRHWRDTKQGGYAITDERDLYELVANLGQRRKRAVLLTVIPGDVVEAAVEQCEETLRADVDLSPAALKRLADAFAAYGVTQQQIEKRCQCRLESIRPAQVVQLRKIYASLKDEMSEPKDWFETNAWTEVAERHAEATRQQQPAQPEQPKRTRERKAEKRPTETADAPAATAAASPEGNSSAVAIDPPGGEAPTEERDPFREFVFEHWLLDEIGEPVEMFTSAAAWHDSYDRLAERSGNRLGLYEQNADAIADLGAYGIIIEAPTEELPPVIEPAPITVVAIPSDRGKPNLGQYLKDFRAAVADQNEKTYLDFVAENQANMTSVPMSTRSLLVKALVEHADKLGIQRPAGLADALQDKPAQQQQDPAADALDRDRKAVADRIAEMKSCKSKDELARLFGGMIMRAFSDRLQREGHSELVEQMREAYRAKTAELGG